MRLRIFIPALVCILLVLITSVSAAEYCSFINITTGPQGVQGIQGILGLMNLTENMTAGPAGYTPVFGVDYFNGSQGEQGIQGVPGVANMTAGPQGTPGLDNMTAGPQGEKGDQGIPGLDNTTAGPQGEPGLNNMTAGPQGIQGIQGEQGIPSAANMTAGPQGEQGIQGIPGLDNMTAGPQGIQGETGSANMTAGPQGEQGIQGIPGLMNLTANMTAGPTGSMNLTANQTPGAKGDTGDPGPNNDAWYIWKNGTRPFTGDQSIGGFKLTNLPALPTGLLDAASKNYVDIQKANDTTYLKTTDPIINATYSTTTYVDAVNTSMRNNVSLNFAPLVSGKVPTVNLGSGSATSSTYLRGDQSWQTPAGGSSSRNYTIAVMALTSSPADNAVTYWGNIPAAPTTTAGQRKIYLRQNGYLVGAELYTYSGTAGTNEPWNMSVIKNAAATRDFIAQNSVSASERIFTNWTPGFSMPVISGDYVEIRSNQPGWATNPLTSIWGGYLYFNVT